MVTRAPRYSRRRTGIVHSFQYACTECGWDTDDREKIRHHTKDWSRQGELIPHWMDERGTCWRKKEAK